MTPSTEPDDRTPAHAWNPDQPVQGVRLQKVMAAAGVALIAIALGLFARSKTRPEPWQPASSLVDRGLYRFTRNPMYLGMGLLVLGVALAFSSLAGALLALAALAIIDRAVVTREEAYLTRRFGADYIAYAKRVRRWL